MDDTQDPDEGAMTLRARLFDCQVCIPAGWSDERAAAFLARDNPCGTEGGWHMRRAGSELLGGDPERQPCLQRAGFVHIMFDA